MMVRVVCNRVPAGDIRVRQPKSPGQKQVYAYTVPPQCQPKGGKEPIQYNVPQGFIPADKEIVWANSTKSSKETGVYRCTRCGGPCPRVS